MSDFLKAQGMSEEDYEEDCQQYAESKVEQNLIVQGIMDAEGLSLDDDDIQTLKDELLSEYGYESFDQLVAYYGEQEVNESLALMRVERFIVDNATVNETSATEADVANEDADPEVKTPELMLQKTLQKIMRQRKIAVTLQKKVRKLHRKMMWQMKDDHKKWKCFSGRWKFLQGNTLYQKSQTDRGI